MHPKVDDWAILVQHIDFSERGDPDEAAAHAEDVLNETAGLRRRANEALLNEAIAGARLADDVASVSDSSE